LARILSLGPAIKGSRETLPCHVVAEIGVNWEKPDYPLDVAQQMIFASKEAGAWGVKFQLFNEDVIKESPLRSRLQKLILTEQNVADLHEHASRLGLKFVLTPMYLEAVNIANKYADAIKIRFKDNENKPLIDKAMDTGKPVLISLQKLPIDPMLAYNARVFMMYCIPKYPPEPEDFNLERACVCKGFSSHFPHTLFDLAFAINHVHKEVYLEKHVRFPPAHTINASFTIDKTGKIEDEPPPIDAAVSITFDELATFIKQVGLIERIQRTRI
jgi:sialic acid synthase SpsE